MTGHVDGVPTGLMVRPTRFASDSGPIHEDFHGSMTDVDAVTVAEFLLNTAVSEFGTGITMNFKDRLGQPSMS